MTELSFLLDLLLSHKLPAPTKKVVVERIKEVEASLSSPISPFAVRHAPPTGPSPILANGSQQSASTQALLAKHGLPDPTINLPPAPLAMQPEAAPGAPVQIAQTPAAAAALATRRAIINAGINGSDDAVRKSPRKF